MDEMAFGQGACRPPHARKDKGRQFSNIYKESTEAFAFRAKRHRKQISQRHNELGLKGQRLCALYGCASTKSTRESALSEASSCAPVFLFHPARDVVHLMTPASVRNSISVQADGMNQAHGKPFTGDTLFGTMVGLYKYHLQVSIIGTDRFTKPPPKRNPKDRLRPIRQTFPRFMSTKGYPFGIRELFSARPTET